MTDIAAEVTGWVADEIAKQRFGEDFGFAVTLSIAAVQTPQGVAQVPMWALLLTARNPLLKDGPLYHGPVPVGTPRPDEKTVREHVTAGLRALRNLAASKLSGSNGHAPAGVKR